MALSLETIKAHPVMRQVLADSYGGIMYDVSNYGKYDTSDILTKWNTLNSSEQERADGIIKGAINFLKGA